MRNTVQTSPFRQMLAEMRGMDADEAFRFVRRNVFSWRFGLADDLRLGTRGGRFGAEEKLVRAILECASAPAMSRAINDYRADRNRLRGLTALSLGIWGPRSMAVYFLGLEQRWRFKNKV